MGGYFVCFRRAPNPANGLVGIIAQALDIGDGHQEQVESQRRAIAAAEVVLTHQAMIHPVEAGRHLADTIGSDQ